MNAKNAPVPADLGDDAFLEKATAKPLTDISDMFFFRCPGCQNIHFRHAGYLEMLMPFVRADKTKEVSKTSYQVMVCTQCRKSFIWYNEQMYEVTEIIDLGAWEKAEIKLHKATGPGGEC